MLPSHNPAKLQSWKNLQEHFNDFDFVILPEVLQGDPTTDPALIAAAAPLGLAVLRLRPHSRRPAKPGIRGVLVGMDA